MKKLSLTLVPALLLSFGALAETPSDESVQELMDVTGAGKMAVQFMDQMMPAMKQMMPDAPEGFWTEFRKGINPDELENMVIPVYQKHLTQKDVNDQIAFFKSEAGQKMISVQPQIMQESMMIGQQWGMELAERAKVKLSERQED